VITFVCEEGGNSSSCTRCIIVHELCEWQEFCPVVLLVIAVTSEVLFECLVGLLGLAPSRW